MHHAEDLINYLSKHTVWYVRVWFAIGLERATREPTVAVRYYRKRNNNEGWSDV